MCNKLIICDDDVKEQYLKPSYNNAILPSGKRLDVKEQYLKPSYNRFLVLTL